MTKNPFLKVRIIRLFFFCTLFVSLLYSCASTSDKGQKLNAITGATILPDARSIALDRYLQSISPQSFAGVVVVEKDGELLLAQGYGWAQRDGRIPNEPAGTVFPLGVLREPMLGALILQEEAAGSLQLMDTFPELVPNGRLLSWHALLSHTTPDSSANQERKLTDPADYNLLARVYQEKFGLSVERALHNRFWQPFLMEHTGYRLPNFSEEKIALAQGVRIPEALKEEALADTLSNPLALFGTAADLYRWQKALEFRQLLPPAQQQKWLQPQGALRQNLAFSYGWLVEQRNGQPYCYSRTDTSGGFLLDYRWYPADKLWVLVLGNRFEAGTRELGTDLARMLLEPVYRPTPTPTAKLEGVRWPENARSDITRRLLALGTQASRQEIQDFIATTYSLGMVAQYTPVEHQEQLRLLLKQIDQAELVALQTNSDAMILYLRRQETNYRLELYFTAEDQLSQLRLDAGY